MLLARSRYLFIAHAPRALRRPYPRRAARDHRRGGRIALLGRACRALLRDEFPGRGPVQRDPRPPVHRRPVPQAPDLHRDADRKRARAIGLPHPSGRAAMRMLENEGFAFENYVDIFDGGPTMTARTDQVRTIRQCRSATRSWRSTTMAASRRWSRTGGSADFRCALWPGARRAATAIALSTACARGARRAGGRPGQLMSAGCEVLVEINFDGIVGPSHNYAGLSPGNLAATRNAGMIVAAARARRCEGIAKMRANLALGLAQGILLPHRAARPSRGWRRSRPIIEAAPAHLRAQALSASAMWAANAATVSPAPDTARRALPPDRRQPRDDAASQPRMARDAGAAAPRLRRPERFAVHAPVPAPFGDEGAANHMRLCARARRARGRDLRLRRSRRPLPRAPAPRSERGGRPRAPARSGADDLRRSNRTRRSRRARSTTTSSRSPTSACCSRTNRRSPTRPRSTPTLARGAARGRDRRGARRARSAWPMRSPRICSTRSW